MDCLQARIFLPVRVLSRLFRRLFLEGLTAAFEAGELQFFADLVHLKRESAFAATVAPLRAAEWVVYAKRTFAGSEQLLAYLARYTHRVAITNSRLLDIDETHVSFRWKKYLHGGEHKSKVMRIEVAEFMRRFLLHVLPNGFHRIRHYGLLANGHRAAKLALCRNLLAVPAAPADRRNDDDDDCGNPKYEPPHANAAAAACGSLRPSMDHSAGHIRRVSSTACSQGLYGAQSTSNQR